MTNYIEQFEILGVGRLSIEDYESPGNHFFPEEYKSGKCKRYRLRSGGSRFGTVDTLKEAREAVLRYATKALQKQRDELVLKTEVIWESLVGIQFSDGEHTHTFNLKKFQVDRAKSGAYTQVGLWSREVNGDDKIYRKVCSSWSWELRNFGSRKFFVLFIKWEEVHTVV